MSKMEVIEPGFVRAIRCHYALADCGLALRSSQSRAVLASLYSKSHMVEEIQEFWSHSWRTAAWKKILCLMILKNGLPATVLSTLVAILAACCSYFSILPPVIPATSHSCRVCGVDTYLWSQLFGMISFCFLLIFWRNQQRIFLDCSCIDQCNTDRKVKAIQSISGILKKSQHLLVLWDPTYVERFWCTFELAAFVKSHGGGSKAVQIQPALLGHFFLAVHFSMFVVALVTASWAAQNVRGVEALAATAVTVFFVMYLAISECRSYYHSLDVLNEQLLAFKLCNTKCWCCSCGHQTPAGQVIPCDREIVSRCLNEWFGSVEDFETAVMAELASASKAQMGRHVFPWSLLLSSTVPVLWLCLDMAVSYELDGQSGARNHWLIVSIAYWLGSLPITAAWLLWVAKKFRKPCRSKCCDRLATVLVLASTIPVFMAAFALPSLMDYQKWIRNIDAQVATAAGILAPIGILLWQPFRCFRKVHPHNAGNDEQGVVEDHQAEEAEDHQLPADRQDWSSVHL